MDQTINIELDGYYDDEEPKFDFDYNSAIEGILQKALEKILDEGPENVIRELLSNKNNRIKELEARINDLYVSSSILESRVQYLENLLRGRNIDPMWDPYINGISSTSATTPF